MELNTDFNALERMVATLGYRKVYARWIPGMLTQERKEHRKQVCQDLLNYYGAEGIIFLDRIITGDDTWYHHYKPESKRLSVEWRHVNFPLQKKFHTLPLAGKVMYTAFWDSNGVILLDFLESVKPSTLTATSGRSLS